MFRVLAALFCVIGASRALAGTVAIDWKCQNDQKCAVRGTVVLRSVSDPSVIRRHAVDAPSFVVSEPAGTEWDLAIESPGYWAPPIRVLVPRAEEQQVLATLSLWRTGTVRIRVQADDPPGDIRLAVESPPAIGAPPPIPRGTSFDCARDAEHWNCEIPATVLDLGVRAAGFVPHYKWDVKIAPGRVTDLGLVNLRKGASLFAWLDSDVAKRLKQPARARLHHDSVPETSPAGARLSVPVAEAGFTRKGAVQIGPVAPGRYVLEVRVEGFAATRVPFEVFDARESALTRVIQLAPAADVRIRVVPPATPGNVPWQIDLWRRLDFGTGGESVASGVASRDGVFEAKGQPAGPLRVVVTDSHQNVWDSRDVVVAAEVPEHVITIDALEVSGRVRIGEEPIAAALLFGGSAGREKVRATADAEGQFKVALPRPGKWIVDVDASGEAVLTSTEVDVISDTKELDVRLPSTEVAGFVQDAAGGRLAHGDVLLLLDGRPLTRATASDGTFRFRGVRAGRVRLRATDSQGQHSNVVEATVPESGSVQNIQLVIQSSETVNGVVQSVGVPLAGAGVKGYGFTAGAAAQKRTVTDPAGRFSLDIPAAAPEIVFVVAAPGRTLHAFRIPRAQSPVILDVAPRGGDLLLRTPPASRRRRVVFNDVMIPWTDLIEWGRLQGQTDAPDVLVIPNVAAGRYQLCADDHCTEGLLAIGGRLELDARAPR